MSKCPKCSGDIDTLINYQSGGCNYFFWLNNNGVEYEQKEIFADGEFNGYYCPECDEVIATSEENAIKFLKGDDE